MSRVFPRNHVKEKLARDEVVASMSVRLVDRPAIAALAASAGYDTIYVDLEHSALSLQATSDICIAANLAGVTPFVRVPSIASGLLSRVLDGGALGIIAPHVESAAAAREVVELVKFAPEGHRSEGGPMPHFGYRNPSIAEARKVLNEATSVVIMIESGAALERLDEIAAVPGVDLLFIGSNDLCSDLGIAGEYDHPLLREAFARTISACRARGIHAGIGGLGSRPDLIAELVTAGARYVSIGADLSFLSAEAGRRGRLCPQPDPLMLPEMPMTQDHPELAAVRAAESALYAAMIAVDLEALDGILGPDLIYIHSTAVAEGKAEYLERVKARHYDYSSIASRDVTVRIRDDLAVINGTLDMGVATGGGPDLMMKLLFVLIWTKRDGRWRLSLRQSTNAGTS